jgi:hypothetical protein
LYETSGGDKGDKKEGRPDTAKGASVFERWVVSCWTILKGNDPSDEEWDIFKKNEQNIVAIISTPSKVCEFLNRVLKTDKTSGFHFWPVEHRKVEYDKEKVHVDHTNIISVVPFAKDKQFENQEEYRFVLKYGWEPYLDSFIFCGGVDYMEKCFVNPKINEIGKEKQYKAKLLSIVSNAAGYGDFRGKKMHEIIANADILL